MTIRVITGATGTGVDGWLLGSADDLILSPSGSITGLAGDGVRFENSIYHYAQISGAVVGSSSGIELAGTCSNISISIAATGTLSGENGIYASQTNDLRVVNSGNILSSGSAIYARGDSISVVNYGTITSSRTNGLNLNGNSNAAGTEAHVTNFGTISGGTRSIYGADQLGDIVQNFGTLQGMVDLLNGQDSLLNRGRIVGNIAMGQADDILDNRNGTVTGTVHMGDGIDIVLNRAGTITGDVTLDAGADSYDGRSGIVDGTVFGGTDTDSFIGNSAASDSFDGGDGADVLDFRYGAAVTVALDGSFDNGGAALGDEYVNFERVRGSQSGDTIRGSAGSDALWGFGGADRIAGAGGNDTINGGAGIDSLTGGAGNDAFRFGAPSEFGDVITDFGATTGNNDVFQFAVAAIGGGLAAGALAPDRFLSRADNHAQDANDRFIFRTTDRTLWFDADGTGAGAAVMVADLQAGVVLSVADFALI